MSLHTRKGFALLLKVAGEERTLHCGQMRVRLLGWKASQGQEYIAQQGQSLLLDTELKVRVRGGGDRGQGLPGSQAPSQLLPHNILPLWPLLQKAMS